MAKKKFNYSDLSTKELEILKDLYIDQKVKSMNNNALKDFVIEHISIQIKNTIGNEEELEAWQEMEGFFKDEFDNKIQDIQIKMRSKNNENTNLNITETILNNENNAEEQKIDMWED
tara:strand:- start:543 stop:893 length:351 start_codon:yes stop_codon:yes gene_type:complete